MNTTTTVTTQTLRNAYRTLMVACFASGKDNLDNSAATFNYHVGNVISERADGEDCDYSAENWFDSACEYAYNHCGIDYRKVSGCNVWAR